MNLGTTGIRPVALWLCGTMGLGSLGGTAGCATTRYAPQVVARGELTLRYDEGFEMWAGGQRVARGLRYQGLAGYVRCVPPAAEQASRAKRDGTAAIVLSALGGTMGVLSLGGLYGLSDQDHEWAWLGSGVGLAVTGTVLAGLGRMFRNSANGRAVDALNYYNDAVGSLGATCADLRYPPPLAPLAPQEPQEPILPLPPPPEAAQTPAQQQQP